MLSSLRQKLLRPSPASHRALTFLVYSRPGCGCCETALELLRSRQKLYALSIKVVDIDTDPELKARYGEKVPVIVVNGKERFRGRVQPPLLDRLLEAESRQGASD